MSAEWVMIENGPKQGSFQLKIEIPDSSQTIVPVPVLDSWQDTDTYLSDCLDLGATFAVVRTGRSGNAVLMVSQDKFEVTSMISWRPGSSVSHPQTVGVPIQPGHYYDRELVFSTYHANGGAGRIEITGYPKDEDEEVIRGEFLTVIVSFVPSAA